MKKTILLPAISLFLFVACGKSENITEIIKLKSDTHISSYSNKDHSDLDYLKLYKSSGEEDRIILRLPTNDGNSVPTGALNLNLLDKPWWQTATWHRAHPFSSKGKWDDPGGDIDDSESFDTNCNNLSSGSCAAGEIKFKMTDFFRSLLDKKSKHYGMIISANTTIAQTTIYSVQADSSFSPRIVATYTCNNSLYPETKVFYFGSHP